MYVNAYRFAVNVYDSFFRYAFTFPLVTHSTLFMPIAAADYYPHKVSCEGNFGYAD